MKLTRQELAVARGLAHAGDYEVRNLLAAYEAGGLDDDGITILKEECEPYPPANPTLCRFCGKPDCTVRNN